MAQKAWNAKRIGMMLLVLMMAASALPVRYGMLSAEQSKGIERPHHDGLAAR